MRAESQETWMPPSGPRIAWDGAKAEEPSELAAMPLFAVCWTNNCRNREHGLYVMHAVREGIRTLCGCEIQEVGHDVDSDHPVSCKRCLRIMANNKAEATPRGNAENTQHSEL